MGSGSCSSTLQGDGAAKHASKLRREGPLAGLRTALRSISRRISQGEFPCVSTGEFPCVCSSLECPSWWSASSGSRRRRAASRLPWTSVPASVPAVKTADAPTKAADEASSAAAGTDAVHDQSIGNAREGVGEQVGQRRCRCHAERRHRKAGQRRSPHRRRGQRKRRQPQGGASQRRRCWDSLQTLWRHSRI